MTGQQTQLAIEVITPNGESLEAALGMQATTPDEQQLKSELNDQLQYGNFVSDSVSELKENGEMDAFQEYINTQIESGLNLPYYQGREISKVIIPAGK